MPGRPALKGAESLHDSTNTNISQLPKGRNVGSRKSKVKDIDGCKYGGSSCFTCKLRPCGQDIDCYECSIKNCRFAVCLYEDGVETEEQKEHRRAKKRASYWKSKNESQAIMPL